MVIPANELGVDTAIQAMADAVGNALSARCVILFGSRARGDFKAHSDVDLAVIVAQPPLPLGSQERIRLQDCGAAAAESISSKLFRRIDVRVWTEAEYRSQKRSINHVAGRSWREGKILYGYHEALLGEEVAAELPHVRELIDMARGQLRTLTGMRDEEIFREEDFGFHAERAAELTLKAWIALTGNQYPLTHFLHRLFDYLELAGVSTASQFRGLVSLTNYAVIYQYHSITSPTMDRKQVTEEVRRFVEHVAILLEQAEAS